MKPLNILNYSIKEGFVGLWKNRVMALASISTISVCLIVLGMSYFLLINLNGFLAQLESEFGIVCYLKDGLEKERVDAIYKEISSIEGIKKIEYISKEDALELYVSENGDSRVFEQFKDNNPMPASIELSLEDLNAQKNIVTILSGIPELELSYFEHESDIFLKISSAIKTGSSISIIILLLISIYLMKNTIRLTVYIRRKEINIMKYVGASDLFIRLPFIIEGIMIGLLGSSVSLGTVILVYSKLKDFLIIELLGSQQLISLVSVNEVLKPLSFMVYTVGLVIAVLGSMTAMRKHLTV